MKKFDYHIPKSLEEALSLFKSLENAKYIAGGTDVLVNIKRKKESPSHLISLRNIDSLKVVEKKDGLKIGSCLIHQELLKIEEIRTYYSALYDALTKLGSKQIRNVATIGGNICNAAPSADTACPLLVLDAQVVIFGEKGTRMVPIDDFFEGPGTVAKEESEIVTSFELPSFPKYTGSAYIKHTRREAMDLAMVSAASRITFAAEDQSLLRDFLSSKGVEELDKELKNYPLFVKEARIALGVVAPRPFRAKKAESCLEGKFLNEETLREACEKAAEEAQPRDTIRGEAWYRREMVKVLTKRTILLSVKRAIEMCS